MKTKQPLKISGLILGLARSGVLNGGQLCGGGSPHQGTLSNVWTLPVDMTGGGGRVLSASSGSRPGKLINILQCPAQPHNRELSGPKCLEWRG